MRHCLRSSEHVATGARGFRKALLHFVPSLSSLWSLAFAPLKTLPLAVCRRGRDDRAKRDGITELSQSLSQFLSTAFSGLRSRFIALFDVADAVMKNLPGEFPQPMGHQPDGPFVPEPRQETAEERLKMTALLLHRGLSGLRQ